jgi:hypothetical protein
MSDFREGWYRIRQDAKTGQSTCRYFKTQTLNTSRCLALTVSTRETP